METLIVILFILGFCFAPEFIIGAIKIGKAAERAFAEMAKEIERGGNSMIKVFKPKDKRKQLVLEPSDEIDRKVYPSVQKFLDGDWNVVELEAEMDDVLFGIPNPLKPDPPKAIKQERVPSDYGETFDVDQIMGDIVSEPRNNYVTYLDPHVNPLDQLHKLTDEDVDELNETLSYSQGGDIEFINKNTRLLNWPVGLGQIELIQNFIARRARDGYYEPRDKNIETNPFYKPRIINKFGYYEQGGFIESEKIEDGTIKPL